VPLLDAIHRNVGYTHAAQRARCIAPTPYHWYADDPAHASARPRILDQWRWLTWQARHASSHCGPQSVIRLVFGTYGGQALAVAWCESRWSTTAANGQYLGLFQMGSSERARYGHGPTAVEQARAAYRYFIASGRDWSPWSCKP
jgi:hypothetical protein